MRLTRRDLLKAGAGSALGAMGGVLRPEKPMAAEKIEHFFSFGEDDPSGPVVLQDASGSIVQDGLIKAGLFKTPFQRMNLLESNSLEGNAKNWLGLPKLMEWVGAGMAHPEWYFGFIIVNAHSAAVSALYGFNRLSGDTFSHDSIGSAGKVRVAESMWDDATYFRKRGFEMEVSHQLHQGRHEVRMDIKAAGRKPGINAELTWEEDLSRIQPLVRMSPLGERHFIFNHKAQMPIRGWLRIDDEEIEFSPERDLANMDEVRSFSPTGFKNLYNWFNFGGFDAQGRVIGLNVFHSELLPETRWTENCIWSGERLSLLGSVHFEMNPEKPMEPWRACDENGRLDVRFHPEGGKTLDLGPFGRYLQKCGRFNGVLMDDWGEKHDVTDYYGCAEYADIF